MRNVLGWLLVAGATLVATPAAAQVHFDVGAEGGVTKRWLTTTTPVDAGYGPAAQLTGHVALLPLIHVGAYFGHDISPLTGDGSARDITSGGLHLKAMLPWLRDSTHVWLFAGFGLAGVYSRSFYTTFDIPDGFESTKPQRVRIEGAGGHYFEVPLGIGASYTFWKPWAVFANLGARIGFAHSGSVYEQPGPQATLLSPAGLGGLGSRAQNAAPAGLDRYSVGLTVGIMVDL